MEVQQRNATLPGSSPAPDAPWGAPGTRSSTPIGAGGVADTARANTAAHGTTTVAGLGVASADASDRAVLAFGAARPAGAQAEADLLVLKFGGTAVGTPARVRRAALRIRRHVRAGSRVVAVVSAAGRSTDRILAWIAALAPGGGNDSTREVARALATGEDRSAALLAAALGTLGVPAVSLRGGEAGLAAESARDGAYDNATLQALRGDRLRRLLDRGIVPVVAGFQAERADGETVTLGRGGSDVTAVFLAGALGGRTCHIVTDVDGVYAADPRRFPDAPRFERLGHAELVRLTEAGAEVVHPTAAREAERFGVDLEIYHHRAALRSPGGTQVGGAR